MILDHLSRASKYYNIHPGFKSAFEYLKSNDLSKLPPGKTRINGDDLFILISTDEKGNERRPLESHRLYIDIQLPIEGSFPVEWHDIDSCKNILRPYEKEKDLQLYGDPPLFTMHLVPDMFVVLFPEDAHAPQPPLTSTKKAVVKVAI
ncbi:MAG: YhcH/YjgK/YiaL family protein [Bacteroidota bacterium]